ncbi:Ferredoxin component [Gracilaria domingensis]|nr:Ferredoxin component [Gracilaria domingensis]
MHASPHRASARRAVDEAGGVGAAAGDVGDRARRAQGRRGGRPTDPGVMRLRRTGVRVGQHLPASGHASHRRKHRRRRADVHAAQVVVGSFHGRIGRRVVPVPAAHRPAFGQVAGRSSAHCVRRAREHGTN